MKNANDPNVVSSDRPLSNPDDDRLGRRVFAQTLARGIARMPFTEGLVIALHGQWGMGKSTVLNFVCHHLKQQPEETRPIIVQFNPWWFSGNASLTRLFLRELERVLKERPNRMEDVARNLAKYGDRLAELAPTPYATGVKAVTRMLRPGRKDLTELRNAVEDALKKDKNRNKRILVLIDDIDRLSVEEIRDMFRLVKAVANFPHVVYLLAFDKEVVVEAMKQIQGLPGEEYLEKVVQIPLDIPLPNRPLLRDLLFKKLNLIIAGTPDELFDNNRWSDVYVNGIEHFIKTPRDVIRLCNTLSVTYPAVAGEGEANGIDFIGIETLRVFCSAAYCSVREHRDAVTGGKAVPIEASGFLGNSHESLRKVLLSGVRNEDQDAVLRLLQRLFPRLANVDHGDSYVREWRKHLRICSPEIFDVFFRLSVAEEAISVSEIKAILGIATDSTQFGERLMQLSTQTCADGTTRVRTFLERLLDYTDKDIPESAIEPIARAFFDVGDDLLRVEDEKPRAFLHITNDLRVFWVFSSLLRTIGDRSRRFEILRRSMEVGRGLSMIVLQVGWLGVDHGRRGSDMRASEDRLITEAHLKELENLVAGRVESAAKGEQLRHVPSLPQILYYWRDFAGGIEKPRNWVRELAETDSGLKILLSRFVKKDWSHGGSEPHLKLDPEWVKDFIDPAQLIERVRKIANEKGSATEHKKAAEQFVKEYDAKHAGKNLGPPAA